MKGRPRQGYQHVVYKDMHTARGLCAIEGRMQKPVVAPPGSGDDRERAIAPPGVGGGVGEAPKR
jgi:hypothetical protein